MPGATEQKRRRTLTCPTCGGAVAQATENGLPGFARHLGHRFAIAEMDGAQARETPRVLGMALRMFGERVELARRLAETQRRRGRPVSAEHWEATVHEMEEAAEVLRRLIARGSRQPDSEADNGDAPGAA